MKFFIYTKSIRDSHFYGKKGPNFGSRWQKKRDKRRTQIGLGCVLISFFIFTACNWKNKWVKSKVEKKEGSRKAYMLGYKLGDNAKTLFTEEEDQKIFLIGVYDSIKNKEPVINLEAAIEEMQRTKPKINVETGNQSKIKELKKEGKNNMEKGQVFLEENSKKTDVKTTSSGLQYKVLKEGTGETPLSTDNVEVHYRGTLIDGTEFDSSYKRNKTITFPLNGVIAGWTEGLQLMKEGAKYEFYIPSELAYGSSGTGPIPPNSVLIFEVELIKVNP